MIEHRYKIKESEMRIRASDIPNTKAWAEIKASRPNTPERKAAYDRALEELAEGGGGQE